MTYRLFLLACCTALVACDSAIPNDPPQVRSIVVSDTSLFLIPDRPLPTVQAEVDVHDPNGAASVSWTTSGGTFEKTGTQHANGRVVTWIAPPIIGAYTLSVRADDGEHIVEAQRTVSITPSLYGYWSDTITLTDEPNTWARVCLYFNYDNALGGRSYGEGNGALGGSSSTNGGALFFRQYRYPNLTFTAGFPEDSSPSSNRRIVSMNGEMALEGSVIDFRLGVTGGIQRVFKLRRVSSC